MKTKTTPVETVVAATDFSPNAEHALDWAQRVAAAHEANLVLVHAMPAPAIAGRGAPEFVSLPVEVYEEQERQARMLLEKRAARAQAAGIATEIRLPMDTPSASILDAIEQTGAGLVVVGTRGQTGLTRAFLGSVAAHVIRDAPCPVLTIPPAEADADGPVRRLLVPTDFSSDAEAAVDAALRLAGPIAEEMKIILLHVWRLPVILSPWATLPMESLERGAAEDARRRLEDAAQSLIARGFEVEIRQCQGDPADVIDREAAELDVDLVAMGTHGRSGLSRVFLGSVAERTLPTAPCPVLTVHNRDAGQEEGIAA